MLAPFATLAFLAALWLVLKFILDTMAEDGTKIAAALAGRSMRARPPQILQPVSVRFQRRAGSARRTVRSTPGWRDAA